MYRMEVVFQGEAFSCFIHICNLTHENIGLRWHPSLDDDEEHLVFEAHKSNVVRSHLNAACIDLATRIWSFVTINALDFVVAEMKAKVQDMYIYWVSILMCVCLSCFHSYL